MTGVSAVAMISRKKGNKMKNPELRKWIRDNYEGEKFRFRPDQDQNIIGILDRKCSKPRPILCYKDDLVPMRGKIQNHNQKLRDRMLAELGNA